MKRFLIRFLEYLTNDPKEEQPTSNQSVETIETVCLSSHEVSIEPEETIKNTNKIKKKLQKNIKVTSFNPRDMIEVMEIPFLSLSKNRTTPINFESTDGTIKVKVTCHTGHYLASIYDWDIILFIASRIQEIINSESDIPPRTFIIPRHKLLNAIHKHSGKTNRKEIEASLSRLKLTGIETTIRNEDYRYKGGFGFIDSWGYTERKNVKEFRITLSEWTYDGLCRQGALLKTVPQYFDLTSGLKRFLYRTARKHVGTQNISWDIPLETLYKKSGSEREFKKFKHDLRKIVEENDIPSYFIEWINKNNKIFLRFVNKTKDTRQDLLFEVKSP